MMIQTLCVCYPAHAVFPATSSQANHMSTFIYTPPMEPFLDILYEDDDIIVMNKPSGLLSVPGKAAEHYDSIAWRVRQSCPEAGSVHRLDMSTSGVILMAKYSKATGILGKQFQERKTEKFYYAWVWGQVTGTSGTIDLPLCVDWENRPLQHVDFVNGRKAVTDWETLRVEADRSLMKLTPHTGRSHQLRVHMKELGHPILGDHLYAPEEARDIVPHLQLHAAMLSFYHPVTGEKMRFEAPAPFAL